MKTMEYAFRSWFCGGYHCFFTYSLSFAIVVSAYFYFHSFVTGVNIPYRDPTPEQAAMEKYHQPILSGILMLALSGWVLTAIGALIWLVRWISSERHKSN